MERQIINLGGSEIDDAYQFALWMYASRLDEIENRRDYALLMGVILDGYEENEMFGAMSSAGRLLKTMGIEDESLLDTQCRNLLKLVAAIADESGDNDTMA